jgi:hypothetical protein
LQYGYVSNGQTHTDRKVHYLFLAWKYRIYKNMQQGIIKHQITKANYQVMEKNANELAFCFNPKLHFHVHFGRNSKSYNYNLVQ